VSAAPAREVACPGCGAAVKLLSAASLLAVCGYCRATLLRRDLDVERIGTMAQLAADTTLLQLGAEGVYRSTHFAVVGRIQVRYDDGGWNEWYLVFDDGRTGWLGEASGEYTVSFPAALDGPAPAWEALHAGGTLTLGSVTWQITDVRRARVVAGEGELPFRVEGGWETAAADLRADPARFATLDYSDAGEGAGPRLYVGEAVEFPDLALRGLRELDGWR
jgi:Domain of unknown function (DUF4178)